MDLFFLIALFAIFFVGMAVLIWRGGRQSNDIARVAGRIDKLSDAQERTDRSVRDEIARLRSEVHVQAQQERAELARSMKSLEDALQTRLSELTGKTENKIETLRQTIDHQLQRIQEDNARQLDRMRETVDEKLQSTLEKRLGESFKQVSERLELVHQGLGDMRSLAAGVGDLKKVLTNVKARGTWGEVQLGALLEEMLAPEQFLKNVKIGEHSGDFVEFAIKLPGRTDAPDDCVLIPVDAKFPVEDYQRLLEAQERADAAAAEEAVRQLEAAVRKSAREIAHKYLAPPRTTDFGIMFLPSEGLYAEIIRRTALINVLQREYHIVVSGPSTFAAFLNSLQMGFRTLAIQKRSGEVWKVLGQVKTAFGRFGDTLDQVRKKLEQAASTVDDAQKKTRTLSGKLKAVEVMPESEPFHDGAVAGLMDDQGREPS
jgi:DNA recombination protein RmuC